LLRAKGEPDGENREEEVGKEKISGKEIRRLA
jgi:hypothetical protein